jgi:hypothetical protein
MIVVGTADPQPTSFEPLPTRLHCPTRHPTTMHSLFTKKHQQQKATIPLFLSPISPSLPKKIRTHTHTHTHTQTDKHTKRDFIKAKNNKRVK